jgi:hypothetical protein
MELHRFPPVESLWFSSLGRFAMTDLHLWRPAHHAPIEDMRGTVHEETSYAIGWMLSALLTLAVVAIVWRFGF